MIGISFKLGPSVDSKGKLSDGRAFESIQKYQELLAADSKRLLRNLAQQLAVYATGQAVRFSDGPAIDEIARRTQAQRGGIRTLLHELVASPLFTGDVQAISVATASVATPAKAWERPAKAHGPATVATSHRMMMAPTLPAVASPAIAKTPTTPDDKPANDLSFSDEHVVNLQVTGLFMPFRADDFRKLFNQEEFPEAKLEALDFKTTSATIAYAADSDLFGNAKPDQIIERLNNRIRHLSGHTLGVKSPSTIPRDKLQRVEIAIVGLDCKSCSLAVDEILARIEGVEQATASFRAGLATA